MADEVRAGGSVGPAEANRMAKIGHAGLFHTLHRVLPRVRTLRFTRFVIVGVVAVATISVLAWGLLSPAAPPPTTGVGGKPLPPAPLAGHVAPSLALVDLAGHTVKLADLHGKIVILNFWYAACDPCRYEMPAFERLYHADQSRGVTILGADVVDGTSTMRDFIRTIGIDYPVANDRTGQAAVTYQVVSTPTTFFIDRQGVIRYRYVGTLTSSILNQYVANLLAEH